MIRIFKYCIAIICVYLFSATVQVSTLKAQNKAKFVVSGIGVPDSILSVVTYCTTVWSDYIYSDVPINVSVSWQELKSSVNAYARPTTSYQIGEITYPMVLAEKILGKNLNGANADIEVVINKTLKWLVETETVTESHPQNIQDLTSTLIHEFAHGLGYFGEIQQKSGTVVDETVMIYDMFVNYKGTSVKKYKETKEDGTEIEKEKTVDTVLSLIKYDKKNKLTLNDTTLTFRIKEIDENGKYIVDPTTGEIKTKLVNRKLWTSDSLYWNGTFANAFCGEALKLYAPEKYNSGSTVYHLDEKKYPFSSGNALMTPQIDTTDYFRKPDIATLAILADIGWNDYFIKHTVPQNTSDMSATPEVSFAVIDTLLNPEKQMVFYSFDDWSHVDSVVAVFNDETQTFGAKFPAMKFDHTISYKFRSITTNGDTVYLPCQYPPDLSSFSVLVGKDVVAPIISHDFLKKARLVGDVPDNIVFKAEITDDFEIDSAYVQYVFSTTPKDTSFILTFPNTTNYNVTLSFTSNDKFEAEKDFLYYMIVAVDKTGNKTYTNNGAYYEVPFVLPSDPITYFVTDFESETVKDSFRIDLTSITRDPSFEISQDDGFENKTLHTVRDAKNNYKQSGVKNVYNQYVATIRNPIVIADNPAIMTFDEVVLVEPGKAGVSFGTIGFWDYVVVEGSKDEENWYPLGKKGWDSQLWSDWYQLYHSLKENDGKNENSLAVGNSSYFKKHTINLLENKYFRAGDTIFIRFRLQSDEMNSAWGWAIDNLKIQERMKLYVPMIAAEERVLYPNPCKDWLYISDSQVSSISIVDISGTVVLKASSSPVSVSSLKPGIYIVTIQYESGDVRTEKILKQ